MGLQRLWRTLKPYVPGAVAASLLRLVSSVMVRRRPGLEERRQQVDGFVDRLTALPHVGASAQAFRDYAVTQIDKSLAAVRGQTLGPLVSDRSERLIRLLDTQLPRDRAALQVLAVGCRSAAELECIERICGVRGVRGLDLFSEDPRIDTGDMHAMPFADGAFDVIYACHSLEHAYDLQQALDECVRVAKPGGLLVIEMPVRFPVSATDRWDVGSSGELLRRLGPAVADVLVRIDEADAVRFVGRVHTPVRAEGSPR